MNNNHIVIRLCNTWDLDESVLEEDNVQIPTDDNVYFYVKIFFNFTCLCFTEDREDLIDSWEEEDSFLILRDQLLSDDQAVVREAISFMTRAMGVLPPSASRSVVDPIVDKARSSAVRRGHMKVIPFGAEIIVEDYVERPDVETSTEELSEELNGAGSEEVEVEEELINDGSEEVEEELIKNGLTEVESTCAICLDDVALDERRGTQKMGCCKNVFHKNCIEKWLTVNNLCPLCRSKIPNS